MSSRIQFDQPDLTPNEESTEAVFYDDGTIRVTQKMIVFGAPHNQAFSVPQVIGVSYYQKEDGVCTFFGMLLFFIAAILATTFLCTRSYIAAGIFAVFGLYVIKKTLTYDWYVSLQFGGMNNHTLTMKTKQYAVELSNAIMAAINSNQTPPPSGGTPVTYQPYFPSPVSSRN
jgi:hypothetical protein